MAEKSHYSPMDNPPDFWRPPDPVLNERIAQLRHEVSGPHTDIEAQLRQGDKEFQILCANLVGTIVGGALGLATPFPILAVPGAIIGWKGGEFAMKAAHAIIKK